MQKQAYRMKQAANDKETRMLRLWQTAISPVDAFYAQMAEGVFRAVKWAIAEKINQQADNEGPLSSCDLRIYDYYKKLMFYYNNALRLFTDAAAETKTAGAYRANDILTGMIAVVMSRIKSFIENRDETRDESRDGSGERSNGDGVVTAPVNPVKAEKLIIISQHIRAFSENFDIESYRPRSELYASMFYDIRMSFVQGQDENTADEMYKRVINTVREKGFPLFYDLYRKALKQVSGALNDFYERNAVMYYSSELLSEHDILRNLATVQVVALESESQHASGDVKRAVNYAVSGILAAYQTLSRDVAEITQLLSSAGACAQFTIECYDDFVDELLDAVMGNFQNGIYPDTLAEFNARLGALKEAFAKELVCAINAGVWDADISRPNGRTEPGIAAECVLADIEMARGIKDVFAGIYEYYLSNEALKQDESADGKISQGIAETVHIKAESLEEGISAFVDMCEPLVSEISAPPAPPDEIWLDEICNAAIKGMITEITRFQKEDRRTLSALTKYLNFKPDNELYSAHAARYSRPYTKALEQLEARLIKFKREQTLYEISTFEEIQHYSVSRLRESDAPHIISFVECLDEAGRALTDTLARFGITVIRPAANDMFNGKEHEVLMAEQHETFKKGEIIKLLNSGYKQGETILMRANVIAAK